MHYDLIVSHALSHPWAMLEEMGPIVAQILARHLTGHTLANDEIQARIGDARKPVGRVKGDVAVLPIFGMTFPRANMMTEVSGATSLEMQGRTIRRLAADESIGAIVLDMDTPGGEVIGTQEFAATIRAAREIKDVVAVANHKMASAGFWIGASATEIVASPSAQIGGIGVFGMHEDISKALEEKGVTRTIISAGKFKVEGNDLGPLSDEARAAMQAKVDDAMTQFVSDVAKGRGVSVSAVRGGFGEGRVLSAALALEAGMIDKIATLDETIARLTGRTQSRKLAETGRRSRATARALAGA